MAHPAPLNPDANGDFAYPASDEIRDVIAEATARLGMLLEYNSLCSGDPSQHATPHFENDVFLMRGGEDDRWSGPQFLCGDLAIAWYKHSRRSVSTSRPVTVPELEEVFARCETSLGADLVERPPFRAPQSAEGRRALAQHLNFGAVYGMSVRR